MEQHTFETNEKPKKETHYILHNSDVGRVDEICDRLREDLLAENIHQSHVSWVTCSGTGKLTTMTLHNDVTGPKPDVTYGTRTEVQLREPMMGISLFNRLANQLYISGDFIGSSEEPAFDLNVGDQDEMNYGLINIVEGKE